MTDDDGRAPIAVANAPVSYGAFELTVGHDPDVPDGESVLSQVAAAGYAGIDLGPVGYLGRGDELGEALARHHLGLAGAYVELPYSDPGALESALPELDAVLDVFDAVPSYSRARRPGSAADSASQRRNMLPARSVRDQSLALTPKARNAPRRPGPVIARCRDRGYEPTFHPETQTPTSRRLGSGAHPEDVGRRAVPGDQPHAAQQRTRSRYCGMSANR